MRMALLTALATMVLAACGGSPTPEERLEQAGERIAEMVLTNPEELSALVVEAVVESQDAGNLTPRIRLTLESVLAASVADDVGNALAVELTEVLEEGAGIFRAWLLVSGTLADIGPLVSIEAIDVTVPIVVTADLGAQEVLSVQSIRHDSVVTIR